MRHCFFIVATAFSAIPARVSTECGTQWTTCTARLRCKTKCSNRHGREDRHKGAVPPPFRNVRITIQHTMQQMNTTSGREDRHNGAVPPPYTMRKQCSTNQTIGKRKPSPLQSKCELQIKCDESTSGKADRHERTVLLRLHRRCMGGLLYFTVWAGPASVLYRVQPAPVRYRL